MAIESLVSGGCIVSGRGVPLGAVLQRARAFAFHGQLVGAAAAGAGGPRRAPEPRGGRPRLRASPTAWSSAKTPADDAARFYRTDNGITLVTREHARKRWPEPAAMKVLHVGAESFRWSRPAGWPTWWARCRRRCAQQGADVRLLLPGLPAIIDAVLHAQARVRDRAGASAPPA